MAGPATLQVSRRKVTAPAADPDPALPGPGRAAAESESFTFRPAPPRLVPAIPEPSESAIRVGSPSRLSE